MKRLIVPALLLAILGAMLGSAACAAEVTVYPDEWYSDSWAQVTIISGGLSDLQTSNDGYMVARCSATSYDSSLKYRFHTGYTPAQVSKITVEYEFHTSFTTTPSHQCYIYKPAGGDSYMGGGLWTTTDQWLSWNTTDVASHMDASGVILVGLCGCGQNSNTYDTSVDVVRIKLEVNAPPVAAFTGSPTSGSAPLTVNFTDTSTNTPTSWSWNFGDSSTSTSQNPSHTYAAGTYTVSLRATNAYGYDDEVKTNYITASGGPSQVYVYPDAWETDPVHSPVTLISGGLSDLQSSNNAYMVTQGSSAFYGGKQHFLFHTGYAPSQVSQIAVEYELHAGLSNAPTYQFYIYDTAQVGTSMGGGIWPTTDTWFNTWSTTSVSTYMDGSGLVRVGMCGCNPNYVTWTTYADVVRLKLTLVGGTPAPLAAFTGNPTSGTAPLVVAFTDSSTNTPTSWSWNFGDSSTSTSQNPSHTYSAGTYTVSLRATNAGGYDDEAKTNYITVTPPAPVAAFSGTPTSGTAPLAVAFTDSSTNTPTSWSWNFGDSSTSTTQNPSHSYAAGTYTVSLRATNAGGYDDEVKTNYITATSGGGSVPTFVAAGTVASGTGTIAPALPAGIASNDILLLFVESANQAASITNQNGGTWSAVSGSPQGTGTTGGTAATALTAFWSRYNGSQGAPTVSDSGNHTLGRMVAFRGCVTSGNPWDVTAGGVEATVDTSGSIPGATTTVANTLVVTAIATSLPDASGTANFSAWTNANLTSVTERTDNTVTAGNGGGLSVATGAKATAGAIGNTAVTCATAATKGMISIALRPAGGAAPPVAAFSGTRTSGTAPLAVTFTDSSTNTPTSWSWNFGDSTTSTSQNPSHTYAAGTYTVSLRATNAGGFDDEVKTTYITATVPAPVAAFSGTPTSGTAPLVVSFTDSSTNTPTSWSWNFGDSSTSTSQNPPHTYAAGTYTVSLRATNAGGFDDEVKTNYITASPAGNPPVAAFSGTPTSGPTPLAVSFTDSSTNTPTSWSWNFGDSSTSTSQNPSHTYNSTGAYTVSLRATNAYGYDDEVRTNYINTGSSYVYVYPDEWGNWGSGTTIQSGSLTNLQADDGSYLVLAPNPADQKGCAYFIWHSGYNPAQVQQITYDWQFKGSRADTPSYGLNVYEPEAGSWQGVRDLALWPTTDTDFSWSTSEISTYMGTDGLLEVDILACPVNGNSYTTSYDRLRIRLDFSTAAPAAPSGLAATVNGYSQVRLDWTDNATNEYKFKIQRKIGAGGTWGEIAQVGTNSVQYFDNTVSAGNTYYYRVCAYNAIGNSAWSNEAIGDVPALTGPEAPSNCEAHAKSTTQIDVTWNDNAHTPENQENNFVIEVAVGGGGFNYLTTVDRNYTRYSHTGLSNGQQYSYRVYAQNGYGTSTYSNTATTTAHALTLVTVTNLADLQTAITNAAPGTIIEITDGTYVLAVNGIQVVGKNDLTIRSQSGNRNNVVIKGNGIDGYPEFCFKLYGSNHITFENMTLRDVYWHCFQLNSATDYSSGSSNCVFRNLYMWDAGEGPIKTTFGTLDGPWCDNGLVENCVFGYTNGSTRGAIEGADLIASANWVFRNVEVYRCYGDPYYTGSPGYGIFAKGNSLDTTIEDCYFEDCGIAISFGGGGTPDYYKRNYAQMEHTGGIMRNNVVRRTGLSIPINDVAVYMNKASGCRLYNNTFWTTSDGGTSIDMRFSLTSGWIYNNVCSQGLGLHDGGTATQSNNLWSQAGNESSLFVDYLNNNFHLKSSAATAINQGINPSGWVNYDFDGEARPKGATWDIGADEY